jgi:hypothetical protein
MSKKVEAPKDDTNADETTEIDNWKRRA